MREKTVRPQTVEKYIDFLTAVKENALPYKSLVPLTEIVGNFSINKTIVKVMVDMKLIEKVDRTKWKWLSVDEIDKPMVLKILDVLLHHDKKSVPPAIMPDMATAIDKLNTSAERFKQAADSLIKSTEQLHQVLGKVIAGGLKQTPMLNRALLQSDASGNTIFSEVETRQKDRVYLAGQIANGYYSEFSDVRGNFYNDTNDIIIAITDNLIEKLNAKK